MLKDSVKKTVERIKELEAMLKDSKYASQTERINAELKIQKNSLKAYRMIAINTNI